MLEGAVSGEMPQGPAKFLLCQAFCCVYWPGEGLTSFTSDLLAALMGSKCTSRSHVEYVKPGSFCPSGFEDMGSA